MYFAVTFLYSLPRATNYGIRAYNIGQSGGKLKMSPGVLSKRANTVAGTHPGESGKNLSDGKIPPADENRYYTLI